MEPPVSVVGKSPCRQVDCLKELDPTLRQKVLNVDTKFLSNPYKLAHEKENNSTFLSMFIPARSKSNSELSLLAESCKQTKYDRFLLY